MLGTRQRARRPVQFRSPDILGGASRVIPAGTAVRLPVAPGSLNWQGFNTLSVAAHVAGLAGGDSLVIKADTLDPDNAAGAAVPSNLGRATIATAAANGDVAGTLRLSRLWQGSQFSRPNAAVSTEFQGFGASPNYNCVNEVVANDATYVEYNVFPNAQLGDVYGAQALSYAGPAHGFQMVARVGKFNGDAATRQWAMRMELKKGDGSGNITTDPLYDWDAGVGFADKVWTLTDADCVRLVPWLGNFWIAILMQYGGFGIPTSVGRCSQLYVKLPAQTPATVLPFDHNLLVFDATGSAHDVTVSALVAELTNA